MIHTESVYRVRHFIHPGEYDKGGAVKKGGDCKRGIHGCIRHLPLRGGLVFLANISWLRGRLGAELLKVRHTYRSIRLTARLLVIVRLLTELLEIPVGFGLSAMKDAIEKHQLGVK